MKARPPSYKITPQQDRQLAKIAAVLAGEYGEELREKLKRWIAVVFRYQQLKEKGVDVQLVSPRPGIQFVRINTKRGAT